MQAKAYYSGQLNSGGASVGDFKKLEVWQVAHEVVCQIYKETTSFPRTEYYGLTAQLRRSAASIPANIAEGLVDAETLSLVGSSGSASGLQQN